MYTFFCIAVEVTELRTKTNAACKTHGYLSNPQHCCIELCQKSALLCKEHACAMLAAMKGVHLKWSSAKTQTATSHQVPIFTACFVPVPRLVEELATLFTQVLCFCPLLHLKKLQAELNSFATVPIQNRSI